MLHTPPLVGSPQEEGTLKKSKFNSPPMEKNNGGSLSLDPMATTEEMTPPHDAAAGCIDRSSKFNYPVEENKDSGSLSMKLAEMSEEMTPSTAVSQCESSGSSSCSEPQTQSFGGGEANTKQSWRIPLRREHMGEGGEKSTGRSVDGLWVNVRNSTSSVFASSTISTPNCSKLLLCLSAIIKIQMDHGAFVPKEVHQQYPYFSITDPISGMAIEANSSLDSINTLLEPVFNIGKISPECIIIALIYINRIISKTGLPIGKHNWRGIVCGAILVAQKVWDDCSLSTASFAKLFPCFPEEQVWVFERQFLHLMKYEAVVTSKIYAQYYFELHEMFDSLVRTDNVEHSDFPVKPLEMWRAKRLEIRSDTFKMQRTDRRNKGSGDECTQTDRIRVPPKSIGVENASSYDKCGTDGAQRGRYVLS